MHEEPFFRPVTTFFGAPPNTNFVPPELEKTEGNAEDGAALGAITPDVTRAMFERTHEP